MLAANPDALSRSLLGFPKMTGELTAKSTCCKDKPRCKRCPVVCKRLEQTGYLTRISKRRWLVRMPVSKKVLRTARS